MKLEDQVCSLELSKRLKELGVKQESIFWWPGENPDYHPVRALSKNEPSDYWSSAFTVAELGEMLPVGIITELANLSVKGKRWLCKENSIVEIRAETEANARAKMLIHQIEKGLVKP